MFFGLSCYCCLLEALILSHCKTSGYLFSSVVMSILWLTPSQLPVEVTSTTKHLATCPSWKWVPSEASQIVPLFSCHSVIFSNNRWRYAAVLRAPQPAILQYNNFPSVPNYTPRVSKVARVGAFCRTQNLFVMPRRCLGSFLETRWKFSLELIKMWRILIMIIFNDQLNRTWPG